MTAAAAADVKAYQCDGSFVQKEGGTTKEGRKEGGRDESDAKKRRES